MSKNPWTGLKRKRRSKEMLRRARFCKIERNMLIRALGSQCHFCGSKRKLEFHHTKPRTWVAAKKSRWQRIILYRRDAFRGVIVLACSTCNKKQGKPQHAVKTKQRVNGKAEWI